MVSGCLAVDVFVALSRFVIALSCSDRFVAGVGFGKFVVARVIRFFPLYVLGIALGGLATWGGVFVGEMRDVVPGYVFHSLGFSLFYLTTPNSAISSSLFTLNPPSWPPSWSWPCWS